MNAIDTSFERQALTEFLHGSRMLAQAFNGESESGNSGMAEQVLVSMRGFAKQAEALIRLKQQDIDAAIAQDQHTRGRIFAAATTRKGDKG